MAGELLADFLDQTIAREGLVFAPTDDLIEIPVEASLAVGGLGVAHAQAAAQDFTPLFCVNCFHPEQRIPRPHAIEVSAPSFFQGRIFISNPPLTYRRSHSQLLNAIALR